MPESERPSFLAAIEAIAAASAFFLIFLYIAGRIYLQAYYNAFHTELADLQLSLQDVMFQSRRALLGPLLTILLIALASPFMRSIQSLIRRHEALESGIRDLERALETLEPETTTDEFAAPEARRLREESQLWRADADKLVAQFRGLGILERLPPPPTWVFFAAVGLFDVLLAGALLITDSTAFAILSALSVGCSALVGFGYFYVGSRVWDNRAGILDLFLGGLLTVFSLLALPFITGTLDGEASVHSDDPGRGLAEVRVVASTRIDPSWMASDDSFVSPRMRLLGRNADFLVLWQPVDGSHVVFVPLARLVSIHRD